MPSPPPLIEARNAAFGYHRQPVITGVDLSVVPGDFIGILGPNGAGKTTLFRGLLGLIQPLAGTVSRGAQAVGYVPQREVLDEVYPLTAQEIVYMGAYGRLTGWRRLRPEDKELAHRCLERVGLADRAKVPFASLSGGQRQRALIARALMVRPEVLVLDEPTSGVDTAAVRKILDLLDDLARDEALAILLVSHQLSLLRDAVDKVLWVVDGRVVAGDAREMLAPERIEKLFAPGASLENGT